MQLILCLSSDGQMIVNGPKYVVKIKIKIHVHVGNKLMFLSEWREFPSVPCLAGKKKFDDSSRLDVVEIARVPDMLSSLFLSWSG